MDIRKLNKSEYPKNLLEIPDPPKNLNIIGKLPTGIYISFVGSRAYTSYGKNVCEKIIKDLRNYNVVIVSGLAIGIDALAHKEAIKNNLKTVAIVGSGLNENVLYPKINLDLAKEIINNDGAIISELDNNEGATKYTFPKRNRLIAGISEAVVIIEAQRKSGTTITARLAIDYNKDLFVVPHSIFSEMGEGCNHLLKEGAAVITSGNDIMEALNVELKNIQHNQNADNLTDIEKMVIDKITYEITKDELSSMLDMNISDIQSTLILLEIKGLIKEEYGKIRKII